MKVALLHSSAVERDLAFERSRQTKIDTAFHLRLHGVGIDDLTAIDRANHAMNAHASILVYRNFGHLGHITIE